MMHGKDEYAYIGITVNGFYKDNVFYSWFMFKVTQEFIPKIGLILSPF